MIQSTDVITSILLIIYCGWSIQRLSDCLDDGKDDYIGALFYFGHILFVARYGLARWTISKTGLANYTQNNWFVSFLTDDVTILVVSIFLVLGFFASINRDKLTIMLKKKRKAKK